MCSTQTIPWRWTLWPLAFAACFAVFRPSVRPVAVALLFASTAAWGVQRPPVVPRPTGPFLGRVDDIPRRSGTTWRWVLATEHGKGLVFQRKGEPPRWGSTVRIVAGESQIDPPGNPGQFDYGAWLRRRGIHRVWSIPSPPAMIHDSRDIVHLSARSLRDRVVGVAREWLPDPDSGVAAGILLSAVDDIPYELREAFETTGTIHLLSTSGFHLASLAGVANLIARPAPPLVRTVGVSLLCLVVALGSGGGAAPLRALGMVVLASLAPLLGRRSHASHTLSFVLLVALQLDPMLLFDAGAQLSYSTVAALLISGPWVQRTFRLDDPWASLPLRWVRGTGAALAVSTIAHVSAAPLVAFHMYRFQPWAPVVNVPAAVAGECVLMAGASSLLFDSVPILGTLCASALRIATRFTVVLVELGANLPMANVSVHPPTAALVVAMLGCWFTLLRHASLRAEQKGC
ncbi:MAG: ComEC/Rec2 family competence protein [Armatimonadota bacterium]